MAILRAEHLIKSFGAATEKQVVLDDITVSIYEGEFVSIMGSSGSGKSTLLNCLSGIESVDEGNIYFQDLNLTQLSADELADVRRTKMGFVFQEATFLPYLNVLDNIILPSTLRSQKPQEDLMKEAQQLMEKMDISELADRSINHVSGGQLQRAGICRALLHQPDILFADEPTGALNSTTADEVMNILREINEQEKTTILLVTHDPLVASRSERILLMHDGRIGQELALGKYKASETEGRLEKINRKLMELKI